MVVLDFWLWVICYLYMGVCVCDMGLGEVFCCLLPHVQLFETICTQVEHTLTLPV